MGKPAERLGEMREQQRAEKQRDGHDQTGDMQHCLDGLIVFGLQIGIVDIIFNITYG